MTSRIVFYFQELMLPNRAERMAALSVKEPSGYDNVVNLFDPNGIGAHAGQGAASWDNAVIGGRLFDALYTGESVRRVLDETLARAGRQLPMYFDLTAVDELNNIPWETLWTQNDKFLALSNWPIGRMLQSNAGKVVRRELKPPFRIAAVLSSLGVSPNMEWQSLKAAVEASNADVHVLLLLSDADLHDSLATSGPDWLTVEMVPVEYIDLQTTITKFGPHVVHLFCHGSTADGPHLEIATLNDVAQKAATSRHRLEAQQIRELVRQSFEAPWAIVLNACSSAQTEDESGARSLAGSLVRERGVQAVVGMRKPVLDTDAACFTRNFYQSLLEQMNSLMGSNGATCELDWASFTVGARQQLVQTGTTASMSQQWTLPVVVVRPDRFRFRTAAPSIAAGPAVTAQGDTAQLQAQFWAQLVGNLAPGDQGSVPQQQPPEDGGSRTVQPLSQISQPEAVVQPGPPPTDAADFDPYQVVGCNAWTGSRAASAPMSSLQDNWVLSKSPLPAGTALLPTPDANPQDWQNPQIGWGVILPDASGYTTDQLIAGADAPEPIRALLASRPGSKLLRYRADSTEFNTLRDYASGADIPIATAPVGLGPGAIPDYLLIVGSPAAIPWTVQYKLNVVRKVGRLDVDPEGLSNYVNALMGDWKDSTADYTAPLIWAVNHGDDITPLMRDAVAAPLYEAYHTDKDLVGTTFIDGTSTHATAQLLIDALRTQLPGVIVTTSHGQTGPLNQPTEMRRALGLLVDADYHLVEPGDVLAGWQPNGAIWFAQACCSAGAQNPSIYRGMFDPTTDTGQVLDGVSTVGPMSAPFPTALLGCANPLRAFIGHVEPTFEWTLWHPPTRAQLTDWVRTLMYQQLYQAMPVGLALQRSQLYTDVGALLLQYQDALARHAVAPDKTARRSALDLALYDKVSAYDRACTVLLGDPTVAVRLPKASVTQ